MPCYTPEYNVGMRTPLTRNLIQDFFKGFLIEGPPSLHGKTPESRSKVSLRRLSLIDGLIAASEHGIEKEIPEPTPGKDQAWVVWAFPGWEFGLVNAKWWRSYSRSCARSCAHLACKAGSTFFSVTKRSSRGATWSSCSSDTCASSMDLKEHIRVKLSNVVAKWFTC